MSILSGFVRTKKYRKTSEGYIWQSEDTHESSVKFDDNTTLTDKIKSHPQKASDITGGTFKGQVSAPNGTDYDTNRMRNLVLLPEERDPGEGATTTYVSGSIICVYK